MAVIGVKYAYFNGLTCGKVTSVSCAVNRVQLSRLQKYKTYVDGATVSFDSIGGYNDSIFNTSGSFRWVTVELNNGEVSLVVNELPNVVLQKPDISATTKQESVDFVTYNISGQSWECSEVRRVTASSEADALSKAVSGW